MKKRDWIAAAVILMIALIVAVGGRLTTGNAATLRITVDGETYGIYDITEDQEIKIGDTNICNIENGRVRMTWADCPDQICVHQGFISTSLLPITCLPNRLVIRVKEEAVCLDDTTLVPDGVTY